MTAPEDQPGLLGDILFGDLGKRASAIAPAVRLKMAAGGNVFALSDCARIALAEAESIGLEDCEAAACAFGEAVTFARLLATDGTLASKRMLFETVDAFADWAGNAGRVDVSHSLKAAALNLLDDMADNGDECAAATVVNVAERLSPEILRIAKSQLEGARHDD